MIRLYILRHIVDGIEVQGPTHSWSMWVYEKFNSWVSRRVMKRKNPGATIMRTYQVSYCSPLLEGKYSEHGSTRRARRAASRSSHRLPEARSAEGYVAMSATTRTGSLVRSRARAARVVSPRRGAPRVMGRCLPQHGRGSW